MVIWTVAGWGTDGADGAVLGGQSGELLIADVTPKALVFWFH
jgi:hypothetical protein